MALTLINGVQVPCIQLPPSSYDWHPLSYCCFHPLSSFSLCFWFIVLSISKAWGRGGGVHVWMFVCAEGTVTQSNLWFNLFFKCNEFLISEAWAQLLLWQKKNTRWASFVMGNIRQCSLEKDVLAQSCHCLKHIWQKCWTSCGPPIQAGQACSHWVITFSVHLFLLRKATSMEKQVLLYLITTRWCYFNLPAYFNFVTCTSWLTAHFGQKCWKLIQWINTLWERL